MSGFVNEALPRAEALRRVIEALRFPLPPREVLLPLEAAAGRRVARPLVASEPYPPFSRSTRDGYALKSEDVRGASPGSPVFLRIVGESRMGEVPAFSISSGQAALIHTGAALPEGADAVVMLEDTERSGPWVEIRRSVPSREYLITRGEELKEGTLLLRTGDPVGPGALGALASLGMVRVPCVDLSIRILSSGDELLPAESPHLPSGKIRDANGWTIQGLLLRLGFPSFRAGIMPDDPEEQRRRFARELASADVLLVSGGSSAGSRDLTADLIASLPDPGLIVRGVDISPGKPTLLGGDREAGRIVVGLPGHPFSSLVSLLTLVYPLLLERVGSSVPAFRIFRLPVLEDIWGKTGVEEFLPARLHPEGVRPVPVKSGAVSALLGADALLRLPSERETVRIGEEVEVWLL
jgi:molybdopterin molybdotransferase